MICIDIIFLSETGIRCLVYEELDIKSIYKLGVSLSGRRKSIVFNRVKKKCVSLG